MERVVILLIISFFSHPSNVDGSKQFVLNFQQSTNKVIVTDLYYGLEYSIWRGTQQANELVRVSLLSKIFFDSLLSLFITNKKTSQFSLPWCLHTDGKKIQSVSVGTGPGGFIRSRPTSRGFILSGRGDEIEFAREFDSQDYSQFSVERRNIRLVE